MFRRRTVHLHYAGDLMQDEGSGRNPGKVIASEFLATSISSGAYGQGDNTDHARHALADNPALKAVCDRRGYVLCDVGRKVWLADLKVVDRVTSPDGKLSTYRRLAVKTVTRGCEAPDRRHSRECPLLVEKGYGSDAATARGPTFPTAQTASSAEASRSGSIVSAIWSNDSLIGSNSFGASPPATTKIPPTLWQPSNSSASASGPARYESTPPRRI